MNALRHTVVVSAAAGGPSYTGAAFTPEGGGSTVAIGDIWDLGHGGLVGEDARATTASRKSALLWKVFDLKGRSFPAKRP